jgi:hypothetical protein
MFSILAALEFSFTPVHCLQSHTVDTAGLLDPIQAEPFFDV